MYYPYLRGKQFELIALRELSGFMAKNRKKVSPIVEPVKMSSTLKSTISSLKQQNVNFTLILNPQFGDLKNHSDKILSLIQSDLNGYSNYQIGIILERKFDFDALLKQIVGSKITPSGFSIIHNVVVTEENLQSIKERCENIFPIIDNIINFDKTNSNRRYNKNFDSSTLVSLADYFSSMTKNADYLDLESDFTEEHLYYSDEGFKGFGDFLTIGDNYSDNGFMPYAVAIHISYIDRNNKILVKHFVSKSNSDTSDIGGKFAEANTKLIDWLKENPKVNTSAMSVFKELESTGHFPGLGVIKKLSIINHIELMVNSI